MNVLDLFRRSFPDGAARWSRAGIDVSGNQPGSVVGDLWRDGVRFDAASVKITEGSTFRSYEAHQQAADTIDLGLDLSLYHWCSFRNSPAAEAANVIAYARSVGVPAQTRTSPVPIWLDVEDPSFSRHGGYEYTPYVLELADRVEDALGVRAGVYTAAWWADGRLDGRVADLPLWVADYDDQRAWPGWTEPTMPAAWSGRRAYGWQFTSLGPLGHLDLDVWDPSLYVDPAGDFTAQDTGHTPGAPLLPAQPDTIGDVPVILLIRDPDTGALFWWDGQTRAEVQPRPGDFDGEGLALALKRLVDAHPSARPWDDGALWRDVPAHDLALIPVR